MFRSGTIQSNFFQWGKGIVEPDTHEQETVETDDLEVGLIEHTEESSHEPDNDPPRRHLIYDKVCLEGQRQDTEISGYGQVDLVHGCQSLLIGELCGNDHEHNVPDLPAHTQVEEMSSTLIYYLLQITCLRTTLESPVNITWFVTWHTEPGWGIVRHMGSGRSTRTDGKALALGCMVLRGKEQHLNSKPAIGLEDKMASNSVILLQHK